ncbi:MAG: putative toxin-antitoxin system antitoxin component (TIGR02293 family) [Crocinitomix sp.]
MLYDKLYYQMIKTNETSTEHYKKLVAVLGKRYIKTNIESPFDFIHIASKGVNALVIKNFRDYFNISRDDTALMLNVSSPTIYRWIRDNKSLERNLSVQLFELTDLFLYGSEIFSGKENFIKWLNLPNTALGGLEPQQLVEIPGGISKVKDVLGRIEHGVYS